MEVSDSGMAAGSFAAQLRVMRPGIDPSVKVAGLRVAGAASEVYEGGPNDDPEFVIYDAVSENLLPGAPHDVIIETTNGAWEVSASVDEYGTVELWFDDESTIKLYAEDEDDQEPDDEVLDEGLALLEPITHREHSAIEKLLGVLVVAAAEGELTEVEQKLILAMADIIRQAQRESEPDETPRWKAVGAVRSSLGYLFVTVPAGIIAWDQAIPILQGIGWSRTAGSLLGGG